MSDTPRTDKAQLEEFFGCYVPTEFAQLLEREINKLREAVDSLAHGKHSGRDYADRILAETASEPGLNQP